MFAPAASHTIGVDPRSAYTTEIFLAQLKAKVKNRIGEGESLAIKYKGKVFYAVPFGNTGRLQQVGEVSNVLSMQTNEGRAFHEVVWKIRDLENLLDRLTDTTTASVSYNGETPISFITEEAKDQIEFNKNRRANREARRALAAAGMTPAGDESVVIHSDVVTGPAADEHAEADNDSRTGTELVQAVDVATPPVVADVPENVETQIVADIAAETPAEPAIEAAAQDAETIVIAASLREETSGIFQKRSHFEHLRTNHRDEVFVDSITLHRHNIVGILITEATASEFDIPVDVDILANKEAEWGRTFAKRYTGPNALKETIGLVPYSSGAVRFGNDIHVYATLGYMMANSEKFEKIIQPQLWDEVKVAYQAAKDDLTLDYLVKTNSVSLTAFNQRMQSFTRGVNGHKDSKYKDNYVTGRPVVLMDTTNPKTIALPGELEDTKGLNVLRADRDSWWAVWREHRQNFDPATVIVFETGNEKITFVSPDVSNPLVRAEINKYTPDNRQMIEAINGNAPAQPVAPAEPVATVAPAPVVVSGDLDPDQYAALFAEAALVQPAVEEPASIAAELEPVQPPAPPVVEAEPAPAPTPVEVKPPVVAGLTQVMTQMFIVTSAIKELKTASDAIERDLGSHKLLAYGADKVKQFPDGGLEGLVHLYNAMRDEAAEEEAVFAEYKGGAAQKADALKNAFDKAGQGKIMVLNADEAMLLIGNNKSFVSFIKGFDL